ncbi:MAG: type II toxin-antitoxin system PemK/MazF family toxin [Smithella sp.]|jgi:mRNA interferase MazF
MGAFMKGDVVVLHFPFTDLSATKKRPALVVAKLKGDDVILTPITTVYHADGYALSLLQSDFKTGGISQDSNIRPNILFTADSHKILKKAGTISKKKIDEVVDQIIAIIKS